MLKLALVFIFIPTVCFGESLHFNDDRLSFMGRVGNSSNSLEFEWPLSGFKTMVSGQGTIQATMNGGGAKFLVSLGSDRYVLDTLEGVHEYNLAEINCQDFILLTVERVSEARIFMLPSLLNLTSSKLYKLSGDGIKFQKAPKKERRIEILGDSNSVGFGVLGEPGAPLTGLTNIIKQEDASHAYPWDLAHRFNADLRVIATSGKGVVKNAIDYRRFSSRPMPLHWDYGDYDMLQVWDFSVWQPDLFIIFLGGNDFKSYPYAALSNFTKSYHDLLKKARMRYPRAKILTICGLLNSHQRFVCPGVSKAVRDYHAASNDTELYSLFLDASEFGPEDWGAIQHLNSMGQKKLAGFIGDKITEVMGW